MPEIKEPSLEDIRVIVGIGASRPPSGSSWCRVPFRMEFVDRSGRVASLALAVLFMIACVAQAQAAHVGPDSLYLDPALTPGVTFDGVLPTRSAFPGTPGACAT
jgi:hypothetical protein